jgi:hypothetical protein
MPANDPRDEKKRASGSATIVFNVSKKEVNHPNSGFKKLHRKLRPQKVQM